MSNQYDAGGDARARGTDSTTSKVSNTAREAFAQASDMARDAGAKAKQAAADTAATVTEQVKELLDRQIGHGAGLAGQFASSVRVAADDLDPQSPVLAGFVRNFANRVEHYAEDMQDQTVEQLTRTAADFTRRQPALVFGLAALAGFVMFRTFKSAGHVESPPIQPSYAGGDMGQSHPTQNQPPQNQPARNQPTPSYPTQSHPTQSYPGQSYPGQGRHD